MGPPMSSGHFHVFWSLEPTQPRSQSPPPHARSLLDGVRKASSPETPQPEREGHSSPRGWEIPEQEKV